MLPHLCTCQYKQRQLQPQHHHKTEEDREAHDGIEDKKQESKSSSLTPSPPGAEEPEDDRIPCERCNLMHDWPHQCHKCEAVLCTQCTVYVACEHCGQMHCKNCFAQHGCSPVEPRSSTEAQQQQQQEQEHQQQQHQQQSDHMHTSSASSPMPNITEQQKARIKLIRGEAQRKRELNKRKNEAAEIKTKAARHDPFAESLDEDCFDGARLP